MISNGFSYTYHKDNHEKFQIDIPKNNDNHLNHNYHHHHQQQLHDHHQHHHHEQQHRVEGALSIFHRRQRDRDKTREGPSNPTR